MLPHPHKWKTEETGLYSEHRRKICPGSFTERFNIRDGGRKPRYCLVILGLVHRYLRNALAGGLGVLAFGANFGARPKRDLVIQS